MNKLFFWLGGIFVGAGGVALEIEGRFLIDLVVIIVGLIFSFYGLNKRENEK